MSYDNWAYDIGSDSDPDELHWDVDIVAGYETMDELHNHSRLNISTPEGNAVKNKMHAVFNLSLSENFKTKEYAVGNVSHKSWYTEKNFPRPHNIVSYPSTISQACFLVNPQLPRISTLPIEAYQSIIPRINFATPQDAFTAVHNEARDSYSLYWNQIRLNLDSYAKKKRETWMENHANLVSMKRGYTGKDACKVSSVRLIYPEMKRGRQKIFLDSVREIIREHEVPITRNGHTWFMTPSVGDATSFRMRDKDILKWGNKYGSHDERLSLAQCKFLIWNLLRSGEDDRLKRLEIWEEAQRERHVGVPSRTGVEYGTMKSAMYIVWREFGCPEMVKDILSPPNFAI
ncbi:hypothetical protein NHQ30_011205 [Ciborinia camelliae]|nr:hypothetical protein NHQ30_011205 [Ciborinia camelliae]